MRLVLTLTNLDLLEIVDLLNHNSHGLKAEEIATALGYANLVLLKSHLDALVKAEAARHDEGQDKYYSLVNDSDLKRFREVAEKERLSDLLSKRDRLDVVVPPSFRPV